MGCEATAKAPLETGGVLVGFISPNTQPEDVVIEAVIGPGPRAKHSPHRFEPDSLWQERELAKAYEASGRTATYIGDWHTHPGGVALPSRRDRRTAHAIARTPAARMPRPLMVILGMSRAGTVAEWSASAYRFERRRLHLVSMQPLHVPS